MSARASLGVHLYGRHVADLLDAGEGSAAIRYTAAAVDDPTGARLSLSLPVKLDTYVSFGPAGRWVRSLLPEGRALAWAVEEFGVPEDDRYALLAVLGKDVAGAVQILEPTQELSRGGHYEPVDDASVAGIVNRAHEVGLGLNRSRGVRLSLAGMQDKVLLHRVGEDYFVPVNGAPSTIIVKPEPPVRDGEQPSLAGVATNELFCGVLARRAGLDVAEARVEHFGGTPALVGQRYDRTVLDDGTVTRRHQEDLLSALGSDPLLKYERPLVHRRAPAGAFADTAEIVARPGPKLLDLAAVLEEHLGRALLGPFLQAATFNIIIGNADAHARNYSVILAEDDRVELAPLYDLICTRYWDHLDSDTAQLVNGGDAIDTLKAVDLVEEAKTWGVPEGVAERWVSEIVASVAANIEAAVTECVARGGSEAVATALGLVIAARVTAFA